jgi:hypothetical protein
LNITQPPVTSQAFKPAALVHASPSQNAGLRAKLEIPLILQIF